MLPKEEIARLSSAEKVDYYREQGAVIGEHVVIGDGTVFEADSLIIGESATIGKGNLFRGETVYIGNEVVTGHNNDVRGDVLEFGNDLSFGSNNRVLCPEGFKIGACTNFGSNNDIVCRSLEAGEYLQWYSHIQVGLGGKYGVDSWVRIGQGCFIGAWCILNVSESITIGDDVGMGAECMIWTHGGYLDTTLGFPAKFAPVRIGSSVWIPSRTIVLPGVTIGSNVVIGINSLVNKDIPDGCLVAGIPVRILREGVYPKPLTGDELQALVADIMERYIPLARFSGFTVSLSYDPDTESIILRHTNRTIRYFVREKRIEDEIDDIGEDFRDFLRRNGIKIFTGRRFRSIVPPIYQKWRD